MASKHSEDDKRRMAALQVRQDDVLLRMDRFMAEHEDHLAYLNNRAAALNPTYRLLKRTDFYDLDKMLTILALKEIHNAEEQLEQDYLVAVFNQYQAFMEETRAIKKDRLEIKIQMNYDTIAVFYGLIKDMKEDLSIEEMNIGDKDLLAKMHELQENRRTFIAETQSQIEAMQTKIALDKLTLAGLQKEVLN
jgi:hypothetical protein